MIPSSDGEFAIRPSRHLMIWVLAARPKTLAAAIVPVAVGTALAARVDAWQLIPALLCLGFALLVQVGTNLANDYFDFLKGADTVDRVGPARMVASGLISLAAMRRAMLLVFGAAFLVGVPLVWYGGWWLIGIGLTSILFGFLYTAGPYPLAYNGLGDLFVFIFFGWIAVMVTFFVQTGTFAWEPLLAGAAVGGLAVNILAVNNVRDLETDSRACKRTLIVRFGRRFAVMQYAGALLVAGMAPILLWVLGFGASMFLPSLVTLYGWRLFFLLKNSGSAVATGAILGPTGALLMVYGLLFCLGVLLS